MNFLKTEIMDINLHSAEQVRIQTFYNTKIINFIDITCLKNQLGLIVTNWSTTYQYIEIRKKSTQIAMFIFPKKSLKNQYDFGWWSDAEIVYSINEVEHK